MFDNPEIKALRQDVDVLTEQITVLIDLVEERHAEIMNKLELLEVSFQDSAEHIDEKIDDISVEVDQTSVDEIKELIEETNEEMTNLTVAVEASSRKK